MNGRGTKESGGRTGTDFGVAYGLLAGAALGSLLMALTGSVMWIIFMPGVGLVVGSAVVGMRSGPGGHDAGNEGSTGEDDPTTR